MIIRVHNLHVDEHMGNLYMCGKSVYVNPFYGIMEKRKKARIGNEGKRKIKVCDNFLVRSDLEKIFNIENHALIQAKEYRRVFNSFSLLILLVLSSPISLPLFFFSVSVLVVSRACTLDHMKFRTAPFPQ